MFTVILLFLLVILIVFPVMWHRPAPSAREHRHWRYRQTAERVRRRLPQLASDGVRLIYLRKINPYVFEELLLLAFEQQGLKVVRNHAYSGDGGLDGQVFIGGERWLIQAKRYGKTIPPSHIRDFATLLLSERCGGFFIHTGRTGNLSRLLLHAYPQMQLVSGQRLLNLLAGDASWLSSISCPVASRWSVSDVSRS